MPQDIDEVKDFLKGKDMTSRIEKWYYMKLKGCTAKGRITKVK